MEILGPQDSNESTLVRLTRDEAVAINNALNESLQHLEEWEFHARMGVTSSEVRTLLSEFNQIIIP